MSQIGRFRDTTPQFKQHQRPLPLRLARPSHAFPRPPLLVGEESVGRRSVLMPSSTRSASPGPTGASFWATAAARCRIRPLLLRSAAGPHGRFLKTLPRASEQAARDLRAPLLLRLAEQHFGPLVVGVSPRRATRPLVLVRRSSFWMLRSGACRRLRRRGASVRRFTSPRRTEQHGSSGPRPRRRNAARPRPRRNRAIG